VWPILRPQQACFTTAANDDLTLSPMVVAAMAPPPDGRYSLNRKIADDVFWRD
jgi:hypothetical protein